MLNIKNLCFRVAGYELFAMASARISEGAKVGLVGRNGTGKSTLFKLIQNTFDLDSGDIQIKKGATIGEISQDAPNGSDTVIENVLLADKELQYLLKAEKTAVKPEEIAEVQERLIDIDAHSAPSRASTILSGLGFSIGDQSQQCKKFSGGWQMRISLAKVLFYSPDLLLLDEPTNFLDLEGSLWLENFLASYKKTILLISHDRNLLTNSVTSILHLSNKKLSLFSGNYEFFVKTYNEVLKQQSSLLKKTENKKQHMLAFVERFGAKASKAKQAQSRLKAIKRMENSTLLLDSKVSNFIFSSVELLSPPIITFADIAVGYSDKPVLKQIDLRIDTHDRIALVGKNGEGKSTFAKLISGKLKPISGIITKNKKLRIGYFSQHVIDELSLDETPLYHLEKLLPKHSKTELISHLARGGIKEEQIKIKVGDLSGGQKARLTLILLTVDAPHILILDEPTNHLDIESREKLGNALKNFGGAIVLVSHDTHLINLIASQLWLVKNKTIIPFKGNLKDYEKSLKIESWQKIKASKISSGRNDKEIEINAKKTLSYIKTQIKRTENQIETLQKNLRLMDLKLSDPEIYTNSNNNRITALNLEYKKLTDEVARAEENWIQLSEKLEGIKE